MKPRSNEWRKKNRLALEKARAAKAAKYAKAKLVELADPLTHLPPAGGEFTIPQIQEYIAYWNALTKVYPNPDEAWVKGHDQQRHMLFSPYIHEPLQARLMSTAELPWHLECEDQKDPDQQQVARELTRMISEIPDWLQFKFWLLMAVWYGRSAVQIKYKWDFGTGKKRMVVNKWRPVNGDSLQFKWDDDEAVGVLVLPISMGDGTKDLTDAKMGPEGRYHQLTPWEREGFVIHKHQIFSYDFFDASRSAAHKGLGLRHWLFYPWHLCSQLEAWLNEYMERIAFGLTIYRFQAGNPQSEAQIKKMAEAQAFNLLQIWPGYPDQKYEDIERIEPNPAGVEMCLRVMIDWYASSIKRFILGQILSSEAAATAVGNETAKFQMDTLEKIVIFDATNLEETLTHQLVKVLLAYNFPGYPYKIRFKFNCEKEDPREYLTAAREFYNMGGDVDADELRAKIGLSKPTADSSILRRTMTMMEEGQLSTGGSINDKVETDEKEGGGNEGNTATKVDAIKKAVNHLGINARADDIMAHLQSGGLPVSRSLVYRTLQDLRGPQYR